MDPYLPLNLERKFRVVNLIAKPIRHTIRIDEQMERMMRTNVEIRRDMDRMTNQIIVDMTIVVYGHQHTTRHVVSYPSNWLEALKDRFLPTRYRTRWPVKYTHITASLEETYPDVRPALPHPDPVMQFRVLESLD